MMRRIYRLTEKKTTTKELKGSGLCKGAVEVQVELS